MASAEPTDAIPMKAIPQPSTSAADKAATDEPSSQAKHRPPPIDISEAQKLSNNGPKTPTTGGPQTPGPSSDRKRDKERKIGHRRVDEEGQITYKKIYTSQIMGSIQLGIGYAVGSLASKPERDLLMQDFAMVETTYFPGDGSNITPAHHYSDFRFKTYAPVAFRYFRDLFGIQPDDFLLSLCNEPMRELANPGASGSIFYLTLDDEFIIKTVQHKEAEFLQKLLPGYYMNLNQNPRTLLPKFFGLYCYQCGGKNVRVVVMNNLLPSSIKIHQKYDLKGSTYKRKANKHERTKESPTYKDLDFMEHHPDGLLLEAETYNALVKTIHRDCRVLESFKIMDYSLLVGIHNLDQAAREKAEHRQQVKKEVEQKWVADGEGVKAGTGPSSQNSEAKVASSSSGANLTRSKSINRQRLAAYSTAMESIQAEVEPIDQDEDVPPGGIPARNGKGERLLLFLGIIDILQSYRLKKKLEHTWKSMLHDGDTVSVHRPSFYAQRFQDFMAKTVFRKIPSLDLPEIKGPHRKFRTLVSSVIALKHSPSKRKGASVRQRPPSSSEADGAKTTDTTSAAATTSKGQEAKDSAKDTSGTDVVPSTIPDASTAADTMTADTLTTSSAAPVTPQKPRSTTDSATSIRTGIRTSPTVIRATSGFLDQSDAISISQITLQTESLGSVVSESSSSTSGIGSTIRTVTWTPPHSTEGSTPTHTEGTPSFTESSSSGDVACPTTPIRGVLQQSRESLQPLGVTQVFHETEITRL